VCRALPSPVMQFREVVRFTNPQRRYPPATKRHPITGSKEAIRRTSRLPRWRSHHDRHRIITALVIGLVIGALARLILPGKQNTGWSVLAHSRGNYPIAQVDDITDAWPRQRHTIRGAGKAHR
jgi:hypothetical protein